MCFAASECTGHSLVALGRIYKAPSAKPYKGALLVQGALPSHTKEHWYAGSLAKPYKKHFYAGSLAKPYRGALL